MIAGKSDGRGELKLVEVVATIVTYRRLLVVCGIVPLVLAAALVTTGLCLGILDFITAGRGFVTSVLAGCIIFAGRRAIALYAPSTRQRDEALLKSRVALPLVAFLCSHIALSYVLVPVAKFVGLLGALTYSPGLPYMAALRLAACMLLLSADILFRFVGPGVSVVRCSSVPLRIDPMTSSFRNFLRQCTSLDSLLFLFASPSDSPGELFRPTSWRETGYRYQRPPVRASIGQILFSTVIGLVLAYFLPVSRQLSSDPLAKMVMTATCVMTVLANLVFTSLDGSSHELDPKQYQAVNAQHLISFRKVYSLFSTFSLSTVIVPAVSIAVAYRSERGDAEVQSSVGFWSLAILAVVITSLSSLYLVLVNEASRQVLCVPGLRPEKLVQELSDEDPMQTTLAVMLESILHGSDSLVRSVSQPTQKADVLYAEDAEVKRGDQCMQRMARVLLGVQDPRACLEQDILRVLLESLGGTAADTRGPVAPALGTASRRHIEAVKRWAHPQNSVWVGAARREPEAVPLLRALCAYAAGLGEALYICTLPPKAPERIAFDISPETSFLLPPGATACAQWSILACARLIVYSITGAEGSIANWRSSSLSILVPTMLHAAFSLRKGALRFALMNNAKYSATANGVDIHWYSGENKPLHTIVLACEESAQFVLRTIESSGANRANVQVHNECRLWLENLPASTS